MHSIMSEKRYKKGAKIFAAALAVVLVLSVQPVFSAEMYYGDVEPGPMCALKAPKVKAEAVSRTEIRLSWKAVKNAKGYEIYRSRGMHSTNFKRQKTLYGGSKTVYRDRNLSADRYYNYEVFAFRYRNGKKVYSQVCRVSETAGVIKPTVLAGGAESLKEMEVYARSWGADRLIFYSSSTKSGPFQKFASRKGDELSVSEPGEIGEIRYYKVKAVRKIGKKTFSSVSRIVSGQLLSPYLDITGADLNRPFVRTDTFIYQLTSEKTNYPAVIFKKGCEEGIPFSYSYAGEHGEGESRQQSKAEVVLESYSEDGIAYMPMQKNYVLEPGKTVYLKFCAQHPVMYYPKGRIWLDVSYNDYRVDAGCISFGPEGCRYSYDY